jgi:hypothetical protein
MAFISANLDDVAGDLTALLKMYGDLPKGLASKHLKAAMKRATEPYQSDFASAAPRKTGRLAKSVGATAFFRRGMLFEGRVGYMRSKSKRGFTAAWISDGTNERITKDGENRGRMRGNGFGDAVVRRVLNKGLPKLREEMYLALHKAINEMPNYLLRSAKFKARRRR